MRQQCEGSDPLCIAGTTIILEYGGTPVKKYILKRVLLSILILFFVTLIIYTLIRCLPTSYIENIARQKSMQPGSKS